MKRRDLADLISRARAALENPADLNATEVGELIEDLAVAETQLREREPNETPNQNPS